MFKYELTLLVTFITQTLYAGPSDHGRWYDEETSSGDGNVVGIIILLVILYFVIYWIADKFSGNNSSTDSNNNLENRPKHISSQQKTNYLSFQICSTCQGTGWVKGKRLEWNDNGTHQCEQCQGYGKILSGKAKKLIDENIQYKNRMKEMDSGKDYGILIAFREQRIGKEINQELEQCSECPYCNGKGVIQDYEIIQDYSGINYKKEECYRCKGLGRLYY